MLVELVLILGVAGLIFFKWATANYEVFKQRGIPFEKPVPFVGNAGVLFSSKSSFMKGLMEFYERNKQHKIVGFYNLRLPIFVINAPEFIKKICIKDFDHFPNHRSFINSKKDPLINSMLTIMKDQRWKEMRNTLTPSFTAAKMRSMFSLMNECFDESIKHLHTHSQNGQAFDIELKDCFTRLSNDLIASTAFGLKVNSYKDKNNDFYEIGQAVTNFKGAQMTKFIIQSIVPWLLDLLNIRVFDVEKCDYFKRLVVDAMKQRQANKIVRHDMIQLLIEAKEESQREWSDDELVAQCFIFFFAAFENNANLICTTVLELMETSDAQERLYEECLETQKELNGAVLNYDVVNKMKYMDWVVNESLRKWPLAVATDRVCSKDYKLYDDDGKLVMEFKEGDNLWVPIIGLHRDERYFPNPEEFQPERFSDDNKNNIVPFTYVPFGVGPRNCIGNRYALMQAKAMLYYLVLNFKFERSVKTFKNFMDDLSGFQIKAKSGFWMRFVPRK